MTMAELPAATPIGPWAVRAGAVSSSPSSRDLPNPDTKRHAGAFRHGETPIPPAVPMIRTAPNLTVRSRTHPESRLQTAAPTSARGQQRPRQHGNFPGKARRCPLRTRTTPSSPRTATIRIDHAVFSDAVHEIRDQGCVVTDVGFQLSDCRQAVRDVATSLPRSVANGC